MRAIKFRGIRKEYNSQWHESKWKFGNLLNERSIGEVGIGLTEYQYAEVIPETVGQFTGLTDKNGVEIYEGDILKYYNPYSKLSYTRVVKYCPMFACFGLYPNMEEVWQYESDWLKICEIEVIGNIHTNPELLNK